MGKLEKRIETTFHFNKILLLKMSSENKSFKEIDKIHPILILYRISTTECLKGTVFVFHYGYSIITAI